MQQYLKLLKKVMNTGVDKGDRTGTGTRSVFGHQMRFNLQDGFPLVTTKKVHYPAIFHELVWMLKGDTNIKYLTDNNVHIWDEWADKNGDLGPVYGKQWRNWKGAAGEADQIKAAIELIKTNPDSRRIIVNTWDATLIPDDSLSFDDNVANGKQALTPCHMMFQFYTRPIEYQAIDGQICYRIDDKTWKQCPSHIKTMSDLIMLPERYLDCQIYVRSNDLFLGCPFNIAFYAALIHVVAQLTNTMPGELIYTIGDAHVYSNHFEQIKTQIARKTLPLANLEISPKLVNIDDIEYADFMLSDYSHHPKLTGKVAV